jgi:ribosomal protein S18 acetylase RimI-like enzyme
VAVTVREWLPEDLEIIRMITWQTWVPAYGSFVPEHDLRGYFDVHYSTDALGLLVADATFRGYLALVDGAPAGYAKVQFKPDEGRVYVSSLYVLPGYQGKGVGRILLDTAEGRARGYGVDRIWLGVMTQNTPALDWYRKIGFQFVEELPFTMGGTSVPHLIGYRLIGSPS